MKFSLILLGATVAWAQTTTPLAPATLAPKLPAPMPTPSMVSPDAVVLTVGEEKFTKTQFDLILGSLPPQQQTAAQTQKGRRDIAEKLVEILTLAQEAKAQK